MSSPGVEDGLHTSGLEFIDCPMKKEWDNMERTAGRRVYQRRKGQKVSLGEREKRRLIQLGVCLALFFAVFFAKGMDRLGTLRGELEMVLGRDADFKTAFADMGWSLASGQPVGKTVNELWVSVFLPREKAAPETWNEGPLYRRASRDLGETEGSAARLLGREEREREDPMASSGSRGETAAEPQPAEESPAAEPAVVYMDYTGPALPENTTMDRYALGLAETVSPVYSTITSEFGWREHPLTGGEKFHCGVDLRAEEGTTIRAFAAGTVDYIGESDSYGQYLQLRHDNGVTSFYAHCSKLCVQKGQMVAAGEKVAESGATGDVTGPHLHFEMKKDGVRLNPAYYIDLQP